MRAQQRGEHGRHLRALRRPEGQHGEPAPLAERRLLHRQPDLANEVAACRDTPKTKLPQWLLESEYYADPPQGEEGLATGVAGTNPAGWKTYGLGLKPHVGGGDPAPLW